MAPRITQNLKSLGWIPRPSLPFWILRWRNIYLENILQSPKESAFPHSLSGLILVYKLWLHLTFNATLLHADRKSRVWKASSWLPSFHQPRSFPVSTLHLQEVAVNVCTQSCPALMTPWTVASPGDFLGKNIGMGCHFLLQVIFPTQGSNLRLLCLLHCRQILYHWATREAHAFTESLKNLERMLISIFHADDKSSKKSVA